MRDVSGALETRPRGASSPDRIPSPVLPVDVPDAQSREQAPRQAFVRLFQGGRALEDRPEGRVLWIGAYTTSIAVHRTIVDMRQSNDDMHPVYRKYWASAFPGITYLRPPRMESAWLRYPFGVFTWFPACLLPIRLVVGDCMYPEGLLPTWFGASGPNAMTTIWFLPASRDSFHPTSVGEERPVTNSFGSRCTRKYAG